MSIINPCNNLGNIIKGGPEKCKHSFAESCQETASHPHNEWLNLKECSQLNSQNNSMYKIKEKNTL